MSQHKGVDVRILNPDFRAGVHEPEILLSVMFAVVLRGGQRTTAGATVSSLFAGGTIAAIVAASVAKETAYDRAAHTGMAQLAELANLPMIAPGVALGIGQHSRAPVKNIRSWRRRDFDDSPLRNFRSRPGRSPAIGHAYEEPYSRRQVRRDRARTVTSIVRLAVPGARSKGSPEAARRGAKAAAGQPGCRCLGPDPARGPRVGMLRNSRTHRPEKLVDRTVDTG